MKKLLRFVICLGAATLPHLFILGLINDAQAESRNRPDLNGLLIRNPGNGMIFWVDKGQRRHIAGPSIYKRLFVQNHGDYLDTEAVEVGSPITNDNRLVRCGENNHPLKNRVYLLDQGTKRHVISPDAMKRNNLNWNGISNIDCPALASIPGGIPIQ